MFHYKKSNHFKIKLKGHLTTYISLFLRLLECTFNEAKVVTKCFEVITSPSGACFVLNTMKRQKNWLYPRIIENF